MRKETVYHKPKDGIMAVIIYLGIVISILIFFGLSVPLPLPAEEGILLNFGLSETGYGENEPPRNEQKTTPAPQTESQPEQQATNQSQAQPESQTLTQDYEEAPSLPVKEQPKKSSETKKDTPKKVTEPQKTTKEEPKEDPKPAREVNKRALYPGKSTNGSTGGEGITEGNDNQGNEKGEPDIKDYQSGVAVGGGNGYSLTGRSLVGALPKPEYNYQEEGIVVVEIKVDRNGNVISAEPGAKGSTTLDTYLCEVARQAALKAKFNRKSDAAFTQLGTITYVFDLQ